MFSKGYIVNRRLLLDTHNYQETLENIQVQKTIFNTHSINIIVRWLFFINSYVLQK